MHLTTNSTEYSVHSLGAEVYYRSAEEFLGENSESPGGGGGYEDLERSSCERSPGETGTDGVGGGTSAVPLLIVVRLLASAPSAFSS